MKTIRSRLLTSMVLTGLVPLVIVLLPLGTVLNKNLREKEEKKLSETAHQLGLLIAEVTDRTARELSSLQSNPLLSDPTEGIESKLAEMHRLVKIFEVYSDISLYDSDGFLLGSTSDDHPSFREYSDWFRDAIKGEVVLSDPQRVLGKEGLFFTVYLPVIPIGSENEGDASQVIQARLSFARIIGIIEAAHLDGEHSVYMLDAFGNILSGGDPGRLMEKFDTDVPADSWVDHRIGTYAPPDGTPFLYASELLPESVTKLKSPWIVLAFKPMDKVTAVIRQAYLALIAGAVCMMVVAGALGVLLSKVISRPLENIGEVARLVAEGNLSVRADEDGGSSETKDLAVSFNRMITELADHREGLEKLVSSRTESLALSQSELERASARLQAAIESTNNGFLVEDLAGEVALVNDLFLSHLGFAQSGSSPRTAEEILHAFSALGGIEEGTEGEWNRKRNAAEAIDCEVILGHPEPRVLHVYSAPVRDLRGNPVGRVWNTQDLTSQRHLEEGLRQSQKMEAVGQLAGGVAHDFNNLLAGILGNLALVQMDPGSGLSAEAGENLGHAIKAGGRAAELVRQLLGFSRRSRMDLKPCDANQVLSEVRDILAATVDRRIRVEVDLEAAPWLIMADVGMLGQVIMNMSVNAKDAMPSGGRLLLRSGNRTLEKMDLLAHPDALPGDFVCLSVEDEGQGMPPEVQAKIFEPFFTTKEPGKGTGLGLATSFGIVKQLGGWIDFESRPGEGTRFEIYLPRSIAAENGSAAANEVPVASDGLASSHAGETILLVDDEALVRRIAQTLLTRLGYEVVVAQDGLEALEICKSRGDSISLVLLDLTMPNLTGKETFARLREMLPGLPVLICSGYLVDLNEFTRDCGSCPDGFVQKPYSFEDMADIVRNTLDHHSHAA